MKFVLKNKKYGYFIITFVLSIGLLLWYKGETEDAEIIIGHSPFTVVIDPGHGGTLVRPKKSIFKRGSVLFGYELVK